MVDCLLVLQVFDETAFDPDCFLVLAVGQKQLVVRVDDVAVEDVVITLENEFEKLSV